MNARATGEAAGAAAAVVAVGIIILVWFTVKATELVIRVLVAHPDNQPMRVGVGQFLFTTLISALTQGQYPLLTSIWLLSLGGLLITAKAVELYYDPLLQRQISRQDIVQQVLYEP